MRVKRAYDPVEPEDGTRFLVDRLWPRGVSKARLQVAEWLKDAAPSTELRRLFGHEADRWPEFCQRYFAELDAKPEVLGPIREALARGEVTLVYAAKDRVRNNAVALKAYLEGTTCEVASGD
jgi:uncharacterized protein YeaO (DUF488 family)